MLAETVRREIEEHAARYPDRRAASLDALRIVQEHERWVSDEHLDEVARLLGLDPAELEGVATFYNLVFRRPVGEHVVLVCDSVSCWLTGGDEARARLLERLGCRFGETTADGAFTPLPICCLGVCERAPAWMVGDEVHGPVRPEDVDGILARSRGTR